jgi:hypothetical protein
LLYNAYRHNKATASQKTAVALSPNTDVELYDPITDVELYDPEFARMRIAASRISLEGYARMRKDELRVALAEATRINKETAA